MFSIGMPEARGWEVTSRSIPREANLRHLTINNNFQGVGSRWALMMGLDMSLGVLDRAREVTSPSHECLLCAIVVSVQICFRWMYRCSSYHSAGCHVHAHLFSGRLCIVRHLWLHRHPPSSTDDLANTPESPFASLESYGW